MNILHSHTGTKICEKCLDYAVISYIFINRVHYIRNRLNVCVTNMLESLKDVEPENKIFIEIAQNSIMPIQDSFDDNLLVEEEEVDETKLKIDVLEDEFRLKESDNSDTEDTRRNKPAKPKVYKALTSKAKLVNGFKNVKADNLNEFLTFKSKGKENEHTKVRYTCPLCRKHFISQYFLKKHVSKHMSRQTACKICGQKLKSKFDLQEHMKFAHVLNQNHWSCSICGRTFNSEESKSAHEKCHTGIECELCFKIFASQNHYNNHMQRHAGKLKLRNRKVQTCSFCEKECTSDNDLSIHVNKTHLQIKPYACDMCDKQFYTEFDLQCHKRIHRQYSKEKCEFCLKILRCRKDLVVHVRTHMGVKPFQCQLCPLTFYSEHKVKQHMKKWHGGSFCCKLCRKVFVSKKGLKDHVNGAHSFF